jgi:hypothetical protein
MFSKAQYIGKNPKKGQHLNDDDGSPFKGPIERPTTSPILIEAHMRLTAQEMIGRREQKKNATRKDKK